MSIRVTLNFLLCKDSSISLFGDMHSMSELTYQILVNSS